MNVLFGVLRMAHDSQLFGFGRVAVHWIVAARLLGVVLFAKEKKKETNQTPFDEHIPTEIAVAARSWWEQYTKQQ